MTPTLTMIRHIREWMRLRDVPGTGATLFDMRLSRLLAYLRHRYHRDTGCYSPL